MVLKGKKDWPEPSYDNEVNNIVTEFFIPALFESTSYRRIAGLFSSNSFALCARGINELISNEGTMELIISPILSKEDAQALKDASSQKTEEILRKSINAELESMENEFEKDHIFALKYLLKEKFLEIRINIIKDDFGNPLDFASIIEKNMVAEKLGIFQDRDGNCVSFRGPIDENKDSWEMGKFSITVDSSWDDGQLVHVEDDIANFDKIWKSTETIKLPEAIKNEIIKNAPKKEDIQLKKYDVPSWARLPNNRTLWPNQIRAVNAWKNNNYEGIFSIATSGGKTLAAIVSANILPKNVLTLVVVPTLELAEQWNKEIKEYDSDSEIIICNSKYDWKQQLTLKLNKFMKDSGDIKIQNRNYVIVTTGTAITPAFQENFRYVDEMKLCIIGDEVHHLGSPENQKIMNIKSKYHVGLSATYRRGWDEIGTNEIINYFGRALSEAEYTISEGIRDGRLSQYSYHPFFTTLDQDEFEEYHELTLKISQLGNENDDDWIRQSKNQEIKNILLNKRADVIKKARNKIRAYKDVIRDNPKTPYIVFADDNSQLDELKIAHKEIIYEINQNSVKILKDDILVFSGNTEPSERKIILEQTVGQKTPIFAMYCLDEGIDVPEFNAAILVSSSRSNRQYIQRRGRILRKAKREQIAQLYDIVVFPPKQEQAGKNEIAISVVAKEFERVSELSSDAINKHEALRLFDEKKHRQGFH